ADPGIDPRPTDGYLASAELARFAEWNDTAGPAGWQTGIPELLAGQVAARPNATALLWDQQPPAGGPVGRLSYAEFGAAVDLLARRLAGRGVGVGDVVGVLLDRGPELVTAVHAILAAGGGYLPLDPELPPQRIELMCATAGARLVVTTSELADLLPAAERIDRLLADQAGPDGPLPDRPAPTVPPQSLAYVMYTSGSTGVPKGVGVSRAALANRLHWMQDAFPLGPDDRVVHKTPFGFDVSVWELCWPLLTGAAMVIAAPGGHRDTGYLSRLFEECRVTTAHFVPSMLEALLDDPDAVSRCSGLTTLICSGEALTPALAERCQAALPEATLHNLYGPTEAAIDVTWHPCRPGDDPVPIGRPVPNTEIRILDRLGELAPIGVPGELCIAGVQLAAGYLGQSASTAERFVPDRYGNPGSRIYRSGDLARWLPSGELEYLGRLDQQVKVRGMRIEPGEIEAALLAHPGVRAAAVIARPQPSGYQELLGYVVPVDREEPVGMDELRRHLTGTVAPYLVPAFLQTIEELPLTRSGKLDRAALPQPQPVSRAGYRPPRDQVEAQLATLWEQLIGRSAVGIDDDFFDLGGHSLLALRMTVRIRQEFGRELPVATVLISPTIRQLAAELRQPEHLGAVNPIIPLRRTGNRPAIFLSHALGGQVFRYRPLA
ncbi:MAG TPA: amino acid adenylation domain-containing protein, partial [Jatrophihabitans sp.]|nr:amino acid adenylation domain-containing protein [Jatrophihabitans sp.]